VKILVCHNHYQVRAGEDQVVESEVALLRRNGHDVVLFSRDNTEIPRFSLARKAATLFAGFSNRAACRDLARIVEAEKPEVAHVHNVFPLLSPAIYHVLKKHRVPVIQTLHNFRFLCPNGLFFIEDRVCPRCDGVEAAFIPCIVNRCYRNSAAYSAWYAAIIAWHRLNRTFTTCIDRYIVLSRFARDLFVRAGYHEKKFVIKPNAATLDEPPVDSPDDCAVFAGRFSFEKGVLTLVKASARVPELPLKILGGGALEPQVRELVSTRGLNHIELLGYQPSAVVDHHLARALVTVFPSQCYENCPMTVINALCAGTPVIGSRLGGVPDFVPENKAGWLVAPGNIDDLASRLAWVASHRDDLRRMRPAVRAWGQSQFSPAANYATLMEVYHEAIKAALCIVASTVFLWAGL